MSTERDPATVAAAVAALDAADGDTPNTNGTQADPVQQTGLDLTRASDVALRQVRFIDPAATIPLRSLTVIFGLPGLGKTTYVIAIAAAVTRGDMPGLDGPRNVLFSSQEDDQEGVLAPRAKAADADMDRIFFIKTLSMPSDLEKLKDAGRKHEAGVIIIDPISAHFDETVETHKSAPLRKALAPAAELAAELDLAVIAVAHPNKGGGSSGLHRLAGSEAFGAAARSVIVFGADPADPDGERGSRRIIGHMKCNVGPKAQSVTAELEVVSIDTEDGPADQTRLNMTGLSDLDADELLDTRSPEERTERDDAHDFLVQHLANGPIRSKELYRAADAEGHSSSTLNRAKKPAGVISVKKPDGWYWSLAEGGKDD